MVYVINTNMIEYTHVHSHIHVHSYSYPGIQIKINPHRECIEKNDYERLLV